MTHRLPDADLTPTGLEHASVAADEPGGEEVRRGDWSRTQAVTLGFSALTLIANVATGVVIARALGTAGRGELTAITALPATISWIFAMGCFQAISYHHAKHPEDGGRLISTWLILGIPLAVVAVLGGTALLPVIFAAQTDAAKDLAQVFLLTVVFQLLAEVIWGIVLGDHDFLFYNVMRFAQPALLAVAYLFLWQLDDFTVTSALVATFVIWLALLAVVAVRVLRRHPLARPSVDLMRSTLWYGVRAHGTNVGALINVRLDLLIIPAFLTASSVGIYSVAMAVASMIPSIGGALAALVLPAAARKGTQGVGTVLQSLHMTLAVALLLALVLGVLAGPAISLVYGSAFDGSVLPLRLLLPGTVLYTAATILWSGLYAANRPFTASIAQGVGVIVTIAGLLLFLRSGGVTAAAIVTTVSYAVVFVAALVLYRRTTALRWVEFLPGRQPTAATLSSEGQSEALVSG